MLVGYEEKNPAKAGFFVLVGVVWVMLRGADASVTQVSYLSGHEKGESWGDSAALHRRCEDSDRSRSH